MTALCVDTTNGHSADIPLRPRPGVPCQFFLQDRQRNHLIFWNSFFVRPVLEYLSRVKSDLLEQTNEYFCLPQLWHRARVTWPPTSFLIRWRRLANELRYVTMYSPHWDQHLLSRATLLPDSFCLSCNICAFCVGYASTHHSISYFTTMSHFPSYFCFFFFFFFTNILFWFMFVSFFCLYLYSFKLSCPFISNIPSSYAYQFPLSPKANSRRRGMSLTELTPLHWRLYFLIFLLSPPTFIRISSHVLNQL